MEREPTSNRCLNCGAEGQQCAAGRRVTVCSQCRWILSQELDLYLLTKDRPRPTLPVAPDGVLRGKYRLSALLGEGAHGKSYLAHHEYLNHPCVVKILPYRINDASDAAVARLKNEARAGFRVNDPHVVRVLDCDVYRGHWYFVMEYIPGADLGQVVLDSLLLPWQQAVRVLADAARGLAAVHRLGLVHRDIKPSNLILGTDGQLRVADLGVAGFSCEHIDLRPGARVETVGTLGYTAPEVFLAGARVEPRADLYSLGAAIFHLVTGRPPHDCRQVFQRLLDLQCRAVTWPADGPAGVPQWFRDIVLRMLATEPDQRFPSATALLAAVEAGAAPGSEAAPVVVTLPGSECLEARGIGVVPFENAGGNPDDEWLGFALAHFLSRGLAQVPGLYVADQDGFTNLIGKLSGSAAKPQREVLLRAGRMVGAGTVVSGRFSRSGDELEIAAEAWRGNASRSFLAVELTGNLADLPRLEQELLRRVAKGLGLGEPPGSAAVSGPRPPLLAARERLVLARQAYLRGIYDQAIALAREAVALDGEFAEAIGFMGVCFARLGKYEEAEAHHRRQEALARRWGDARLQIEALANLGVMYYFRGDYDAAEVHYAQAAEMARELGLAVEEAQVSNNLGFVLFRRGRLEEAERAFLRAIETHRAYGGLTALVGPYNGLGNVLVEQGRFAEARTYYRRALALAEEIGDRTIVGTTHMHLGRAATLEERFSDAKHEFTMALNALEETRFWNGLARAYEYIADLHLRLGNFDEVVRCADKRIELARQHSNLRMEAAAWRQKAESLRRAGRVEEAEACLARGRIAEEAAGGA
jgi:serine/threonine protein kinase/tetratricopeptide (TPR) repeat protein